ATRTDFHVGGVPSLGMASGIGPDNHRVSTLGKQGVKMGVMDGGGGTVPRANHAPLVQNVTELAAHNPAMMTLPLLPNLRHAAPFPHGVDQLDAIAVCHA